MTSSPTRRNFLFAVAALPLLTKNKKFLGKVRTKQGSVISNILVEATDQFAAAGKLMDKYPECTILGIQEK